MDHGKWPEVPGDSVKRFYDRFDETGRAHIRAQQDVFRFVQTHRRRGKFVAPIAVLQGRNDGWNCFSRDKNLWAQEGEEWKFGPAEQSFDLLNVFYPRNFLGAIYRFPCPARPQGWYSGSPYGPVDLLPVEAPAEVLASYQAMAFLGWNSFQETDFVKLLAYVRQGGKLLLARPHLSMELRHNQPSRIPASPTLTELLGKDFERDTGPVHRQVGEGEVVFFPEDKYPADPGMSSAYRKELENLGETALRTQSPRGWVRGTQDVEFTAWDWEDGKHRTIYLLNIDWWSPTNSHPASLLLGGRQYPLEVRRGTIETVTIYNGKCAIQPLHPLTDVRQVKLNAGKVEFEIETTDPGEVAVFHEDHAEPIRVPVPCAGIHRLAGIFPGSSQ